MTSPAPLQAGPDAAERLAAIDPRRSFLVQAPAGSGKTELLIQRLLRLLPTVDQPEAILAITFTRKAAGEMRDRVLEALSRTEPPSDAHEQLTHSLAAAVRRHDQAQGWNLLEHPSRLRIQTIDSLCGSITARMPWLARLGAPPRVEEDSGALYAEAAARTVLYVEEDGPYRAPLSEVLLHLDNNAQRMADLIANMLQQREQWLEFVGSTTTEDRAVMEAEMCAAIEDALRTVDALFPASEHARILRLTTFLGYIDPADPWPSCAPAGLNAWLGIRHLLLTAGGAFRKPKGLNVRCGFPRKTPEKEDCADLLETLSGNHPLEAALDFLDKLPPAQYDDAQWDLMRSLLDVLKLAIAQLQVVFREEGATDFTEISIRARQALGDPLAPTDLLLQLDARIQHLLVDEFQDTSSSQIDLLLRLTSGWQPGDGRTLFLVGDPMQSIYRFRQADVGLFLQTRVMGLGELRPEALQLRVNYRSVGGIVQRVNQLFSRIFPPRDVPSTGAITYSESVPHDTTATPAVHFHAEPETAAIPEIVRQFHAAHPNGKAAVLVRARSHVPPIVEALKRAGIAFRAVDIDPLNERTVVKDLMALTRAMLHFHDRIAWLAILRAPWCGLTLADLHALIHGDRDTAVWTLLAGLSALSPDGAQRDAKLRAVLQQAFDERGRQPLRQWIEHTWWNLGGPATAANLADSRDYFDLLESLQSGPDLPDPDSLLEHVNRLYARPTADADTWLDVMTIHKSKGLQFDCVIVPQMGRSSRGDSSKLVLFHHGLFAPIAQTGEDDYPLAAYLKALEKKKSDHERVRQLYVAATRARKELHLFGTGNLRSGTFLGDLWPALSDAEQALFTTTQPPDTGAGTAPQPAIRRLPLDWTPPAPPPAAIFYPPVQNATAAETHTYEWVGNALRHAGTLVHELLSKGVPPSVNLRRALTQLGVSPQDLDIAQNHVEKALQRTMASPRGQWILAPHEAARSEYAICGVLAGQIVRGTIDRTFVEDGTRWIVDYKTSTHQGAGLEAFLDDQQRRHGAQLERYALLLAPLGLPVRVGLYFPLLDAWREWQPKA